MELHALDWPLAVPEAHDEAVGGVRRGLQALWQAPSLKDQAVIAACRHGLGEPAEEALAVVVDRCLMPVHRLSAHDAPTEVDADGLMAEADPKDREGLRCVAEALQRGRGSLGDTWTRTKDQARRLQGLDHAPVRPVAAQDLDLCAQLLEELGEVESEGVSIVEDDDHSAQDASFRGLKAKKTPSLVSRLAVGPSWNKVPR